VSQTEIFRRYRDLLSPLELESAAVELRKREQQHGPGGRRGENEYRQEDFPELKESAPLPLR
jgi:hypothetical protein